MPSALQRALLRASRRFQPTDYGRLCGLPTVGGLNLGGGIDPIYSAVSVAEVAVERGATLLLIPISARRQLNELSDEMAMRLSILYYADVREALLKALGD
jgi:ATP-dependent Lon protease